MHTLEHSKNRRTRNRTFRNWVGAFQKLPDRKGEVQKIAEELGVRLQYINSALVSAQQRKRFYAHNFGDVPLPEDRGIRLTDILLTPEKPTGARPPKMIVKEATLKGFTEIDPGSCVDLTQKNSKTRRGRRMQEKSNCVMTGNQYFQYIGTIQEPLYEIENGTVTIEGA